MHSKSGTYKLHLITWQTDSNIIAAQYREHIIRHHKLLRLAKMVDANVRESQSVAIQQRPRKEDEHGREFCRGIASAAIKIGQTRVHAEIQLQSVRLSEKVGMQRMLNKNVQVGYHDVLRKLEKVSDHIDNEFRKCMHKVCSVKVCPGKLSTTKTMKIKTIQEQKQRHLLLQVGP